MTTLLTSGTFGVCAFWLRAGGAIGLILTACSSSSGAGAPSGDAGAVDGAPFSDASAHDADDASGKPFAPFQLRSFESNAEGVSDACKIADYAKARAILGEANTNWTALKPQVQAASAPAPLVARIDDTLAKIAADLTGSMQRACESDANVVTLAVPDLFDLYSFPVPSDALRGDGVFRQLQIDGEYSDFAAGVPDLAATKAVWARLKPLVVVQAPTRADIPGSATVVADMDKAIADCDAAIKASDRAALGVAAQNGLDDIDVVETIFK